MFKTLVLMNNKTLPDVSNKTTTSLLVKLMLICSKNAKTENDLID